MIVQDAIERSVQSCIRRGITQPSAQKHMCKSVTSTLVSGSQHLQIAEMLLAQKVELEMGCCKGCCAVLVFKTS